MWKEPASSISDSSDSIILCLEDTVLRVSNTPWKWQDIMGVLPTFPCFPFESISLHHLFLARQLGLYPTSGHVNGLVQYP
jgi:hypothetical protein